MYIVVPYYGTLSNKLNEDSSIITRVIKNSALFVQKSMQKDQYCPGERTKVSLVCQVITEYENVMRQ